MYRYLRHGFQPAPFFGPTVKKIQNTNIFIGTLNNKWLRPMVTYNYNN